MGVYINGMDMPTEGTTIVVYKIDGELYATIGLSGRLCPLVPVPPHGRLRRRVVYRGEVYNALESARINALDGVLTDRYKDGFHDGLKRALEILANEVQDAPTIIPAEEGEI